MTRDALNTCLNVCCNERRWLLRLAERADVGEMMNVVVMMYVKHEQEKVK